MKQGVKFEATEEDREYVLRCTQLGMNKQDIADTMKISYNTLSKYFKYEITVGRAKLGVLAVTCLSEAMEAGSVDASKFVLSRQHGWVEKKDIDLTSGGDKVNQVNQVVLSSLTDEQIEEALEKTNPIKGD